MDLPRFDPTDPTGWFLAWNAAMRSMLPTAFRYEQVDPRVQEIAILATMHNMASLITDSEGLKSEIAEQLARRAARLGKAKGGA
ncbi:MAG: hypothetical protein ABSH03_13405 [Candidatus Lustribacter sp.]|jgi:hypothetical protein